MPEIAVVITCYNKADYISKAISSALICTQNVIVVDDQSTDDSWEKISKFEQVKKIREPINMGVTAATIAGVEAARKMGFDFVALLDGDDMIAPDALFHYGQIIDKFGADAVYSSCVRCNKDYQLSVRPIGGDFKTTQLEDPLSYYLHKFPASTAVCARCEHMLQDLDPAARIQDHQIAFSIHRNAKTVVISTGKTHYCSPAVAGRNLALDTPQKSLSAVLTYAAHWHLIDDHPLAHRMRNRAFSQLLRLVGTNKLPRAFSLGLLRFSLVHQWVAQERKHRVLMRAAEHSAAANTQG